MYSIFSAVGDAPPIEVFELSEACKKDPNLDKVDMTVGAYRTDEGLPFVFPTVRAVEQSMAADTILNKEYLPVAGLDSFCLSAMKLLLGQENPLILSKKADSCQALGGTGAIHLAAKFLSHVLHSKICYVSNPTWPNHRGIAELCGMEVRKYRYWSESMRKVDFDGLLEDLQGAPASSVVILHACAHNPTGMDLSKEQWISLASLCKEKNLIPLFDVAYQGFASSDLDEDAWAVRYFASKDFELFACQSFSKNFGLYNERVGNLTFITNDPKYTVKVKSQLKILIRQTWSNPPNHGARIVSTILNNPVLYSEWNNALREMPRRIVEMRKMLFEKLRALGTPGAWDHLVKQRGLFSFTGLSKAQSEHIREKYHVYVLNDGRMNTCALTTKNIDYVARAVHETVTQVPD